MSMGSTLLSAGSKKCPAAVSATLITGTQMALGYVVDVLCTLDVKEDGMKPHEISKSQDVLGLETTGDVDPRFPQVTQAG